ncbi:MAG: Lrp/AsnC family transcriptional regulator [Thermodesulfobacteriota bacterium]
MDELNRKIIQALQVNGRKTNSDLAREFGVAPSTMLERIRQLEERGVVLGYRAIINPQALGFNIQGFVSVTLDRHNVNYIRSFEKGIQKIPNVRACYHVTGRFDYLVHVAARDLEHLGEIIKEKIASISGIGKVETFLVLSEVKGDGGLPIEYDNE